MRCLVLGGRCSGQRLGHPSYLLCRALETAIPLCTGIERTWGWVQDMVTMLDTPVKEGILIGDW